MRWKSMSLLLPFQILRAVANEPLVTGPLLYMLTRGPTHIRERLLRPFRRNLLAKNGESRLSTTIAVLKVYFMIGVIHRINKALNRLALNGWALRRQGEPFVFGPSKQELVVITGGSSGFGYEMVKAFSKVARVIAFDVSDLPPDLESRKSFI
jgi:all-trans-retinol dehydrogenase (NAD+)